MKNSGFKLRSQGSSFKMMGSSPYQTHGEESNSPLNQWSLLRSLGVYGPKILKRVKSLFTKPKAKGSKVNRNPTPEYRYNEHQRGARNPDGTRR